MESVSGSILTPYAQSFDTNVLSVAFHPTEPRLATGGSVDGTAKIWTFIPSDLQNFPTHLQKKPHITSSSRVNSVSISDNSIGSFLATTSNARNVKVINITSNEVVNLPGRSEYSVIVSCVACHPTMNIIVTGDNDAKVNVWKIEDTQKNTPIHIAELTGHTNIIISLAFHPMLTLFASGSFDNTAILWSFSSDGSNIRGVARLLRHTGCVASVAFHPDPMFPLFATGSYDKTAKLWRYSPDGSIATTCIATLTGHTDFVLSVAFHPTVPLLATGSRDMTAKLWRFSRDGTNATCVETITYTQKVRSLSFHLMLPVLAICHDGVNSVTLYDCTKIPTYYEKYMKDMESIRNMNRLRVGALVGRLLLKDPDTGPVPQGPLRAGETQVRQRLEAKLKQVGRRGGSKRGAKTRYRKRSRKRCKSRSTSKTR
jgi:WD40 repeat protein